MSQFRTFLQKGNKNMTEKATLEDAISIAAGAHKGQIDKA
jgi:hypothetical protein